MSHVRAAQSLAEQPEACIAMLAELAIARQATRQAAAILAGHCLADALEAAAHAPAEQAEDVLQVVEHMGDLILGVLCPACRREVGMPFRRRRKDDA